MGDTVSVLSIRSLRYRWPGEARDTVLIGELSVYTGEQVYLRGPSGCGKGTLLSVIAGVLDADYGVVAVNGRPWADVSGARRDALRADDIGIIFQQFNLLPYLSAVDNVSMGCRFSARRLKRACFDAPNSTEAARRLLLSMGLPPALHEQAASRLSVGQVAAARALIGGPALLLADEPTSALDEPLKAQFMDLLQTACGAAGSALLFVSHDSRLAARFDRVLSLPELASPGAA